MKYYPKIKFGINKIFEKRILYNTSHAQWALRPELKFLFKDEFKNSRQKILSAYVDNYYEVYKKKSLCTFMVIKLGLSDLNRFVSIKILLIVITTNLILSDVLAIQNGD